MKAGAFTLVELLVVIAIIALLMGMLIPSMGAARDQSKSLICLTNLKQLITAAHAYAADNEDFYPMAVVSTRVGNKIVSACWDFTTTTVSGQKTVEPGRLWQGSTTIKVQQCPAYMGPANWDVDPFSGYNYNASFIGGRSSHNEGSSSPGVLIRSARITDVKSSSTTAVFGDGEQEGGANKFMRSPLPGDLDPNFTERFAGAQGFRHNKATNVALADGSTQTVTEPAPQVINQPCAKGTGFLSADNSAYDLK
jgi:prepilin-type N-terminal cleavage/methylation domain-containing protein/prepilin-type processing-associated H-X9-DG protein